MARRRVDKRRNFDLKVPCAKSSNEMMKTELCYCASGCQKVRGTDMEIQFIKGQYLDILA